MKKSSHVYKHSETSQGCREQCNETSFTILDYAPIKGLQGSIVHQMA